MKTRLGKHHWFPKRYIKTLAKTHHQIYRFLDAMRLLICRKCEDKIHPENEWYHKYNVAKKEWYEEARSFISKEKASNEYIIELKENLRKLNNSNDLLQQKIEGFNPNKETNQLETVLQGKNQRITALSKKLLMLPKLEKELERYKKIVRNMNNRKKIIS